MIYILYFFIGVISLVFFAFIIFSVGYIINIWIMKEDSRSAEVVEHLLIGFGAIFLVPATIFIFFELGRIIYEHILIPLFG